MDPFTAILINLIIGVILSAASTLLQQAFAPRQEQQRRTGTRGSTMFGGKVPQYFLVGTVGEAGKREYPRKQWGTAGGVPNAYNVDVLSFGDLPITALTKLFLNGVLEPVSASGHVEQGYPTTGDKAGFVWLEFFDGNQTTANSYLVSKFGSDPDHPWTAGMIGRGVPYLTLTSLWAEGKWSSFPEVLAEVQGIKLYDPRQDSTAGGTGSQRRADPSTWAFSDNNMVIAYNIEAGIHYNASGATTLGPHIWGGKKSAAQLPYAVWAAAMDACDELVTLDAGGTEKRFRAGRRINLNERPADVLKELFIGANARRSEAADGTVYVLVGVPSEADGSFTQDDVLASEPLGSIPFPNLDEVINGAVATYREPSQAWEDKETAPYYRADLEDEDDGRQQIEGLDLGTTFSGTQAQRILKAVIEEGRRFRRHVVALPPEFAQYHPLSVLAWTSDRFDYDAKLFLVTARTISPWGQVVLGLQEIDPADHDWDPETDEQPLSFAPVTINRPAPQPMSGWQVFPDFIPDATGAPRRPSIGVQFAGGMPDVATARVQVRVAATAALIYDAEEPYPDLVLDDDDLAYVVLNGTFLPDEGYEVRGKFVPISDRVTNWSDWLAVTTPNVKLGPADIDIDAALADVAENLAWVGQGVREAIRNFERLGSIIAEQDLANFNDRQVLTREMRKKVGDLEASFTEIIEVALGPGGAIALQLSSLYAALGGNTAQVNMRAAAVAAPDGYSASYAWQAAVDDGTFRQASHGVDVPANPADPTRFWVVADQFIVTDGTNDHIPFVFQSGEAIIESVRFKTLSSIAMADGSTPVILIDGENGTISITVP